MVGAYYEKTYARGGVVDGDCLCVYGMLYVAGQLVDGGVVCVQRPRGKGVFYGVAVFYDSASDLHGGERGGVIYSHVEGLFTSKKKFEKRMKENIDEIRKKY